MQTQGTKFNSNGSDRREASGAGGVSSGSSSNAHENLPFAPPAFPDPSNAAAVGLGTPGASGNNLGGSAGGIVEGPVARRFSAGQEQLIPAYVPLQKQGSLSQATHRRSLSRNIGTATVAGGGGGAPADGEGCSDGGAGGGGGGAEGAGRRGLSVTARSASPPQSPYIVGLKMSPRRLPPVPAFGGAGGGGATATTTAGASGGVTKGMSPLPAPPPPSLNGGTSAIGGAIEEEPPSVTFDYAFLPPTSDSLSGKAGVGGLMRDARAGAASQQVHACGVFLYSV